MAAIPIKIKDNSILNFTQYFSTFAICLLPSLPLSYSVYKELLSDCCEAFKHYFAVLPDYWWLVNNIIVK